ncbi:MAG: hypothetical protein S0880_26310 [Actinomycetota bacterium]|nr:hypothetical protein [Actinomycetota bacterium]
MTDLDQLLVVQEQDNAADALAHKRANLAERAVLAGHTAELETIDRGIADAEARRHELARVQKRHEDEARSAEDHAAQEEKKLYSGTVTGARELQDLQSEVDSLRRRQAEIEDQVLEVMVEIEPIDTELAELRARREPLAAAVDTATVALAEAEAAVDAELAEVKAARDAAAADVPADALDAYTKTRPLFGGTTVAKLVGRDCVGCPLAIPAVEADRIKKAPPGFEWCDECGRVVIH